MTPNRKPGAEQVLTIAALGHRGDGIAESEAGRIFVPYSLEGEQVRAEVQKSRGRILEIIDPSPDRVSPFCPHFGACGGCTSQHMNDRAYRQWKLGLVENALKLRGLDVPVANLVDAHGAGRRRVTIHMNIVKGQILAGFMETRSHRLLNIDTCPVLAPDLENITDICRKLATAVRAGKKPFDIRVNATKTGLDCDIGIGKDPDATALIELSDVAAKYDLARVCLDGNMLLERRAPVI
ncbi:MAG: hypothetical protein K8F25_01655, partial [Fimbriimonadaceae bacterium]|nr:hypothetical protein [Alphaproteobacteria bacterium]